MSRKRSSEDSKNSGCYLSIAFGSLMVIGIVSLFWPGVIPYDFWQFVKWEGSFRDILILGRPLFVWAIFISVTSILWFEPGRITQGKSAYIMLEGIINSAIAGIFEEITFRWLLFYSQIAMYTFIGFITFGIAQWLHLHIDAPIVNFLTGGHLADYLYNPINWAVGAALVTSNGRFRDGHAYQGWIGTINSWFIGMFLFYAMFNHGLYVAMFLHFSYNMIIYSVVFVYDLLQQERRKRKEKVKNDGVDW